MGRCAAGMARARLPRRVLLWEIGHMALPREWILPGYIAVSTAVLLWDVLLAAQIARARRQSRFFLALTSICALFIVPGALIVVASSMVLTGRAIHLVSWVWPAVLLFYVAQSAYAIARRHATLFFAVPIFFYNVTLLAAALSRYLSGWVADLPAPLLGAAVAQSGAMGFVFGREALGSPWLVALPLLAPAFPARYRVSSSVRAGLAVVAAAGVALTFVEYPRAVFAAESFSSFGSDRLQERPRGDFTIGLHVFPALDGAPPPLPLERDLALADTLGARVVSVTLVPDGVGAMALDSLAASLADIRRDSVLLVVSLGYGRDDAIAFRGAPETYLRRRLALIDQVVRRVRPDVLVPALDPGDIGDTRLGSVPLGWWRDYLTRSAELAHRLRPRTRVALAAASFSPRDSSLYSWGAQHAGIDLLGFSLAPSFGGGASLSARLRLAERWMRTNGKEHWVFSARAYPRTFGERNQERAIWGILAWATSQPRVRTVIVDGAGDYESLVGLRDPGGRLRPVVVSVARAREALAETAEGR